MRIGKKLLVAILAFCCAFGGAACNPDDGVPTDKPAITLTYYQAGYGDAYIKALQKAFNDRAQAGEYDFYLKLQPDPQAAVNVRTAIVNKEYGSTIPDLAILESISLREWVCAGYLTDISDVWETEVPSAAFEGGTATIAEKIEPVLGERLTVEGKRYSIPMQGGVTGLLYNKTLLKEITGSDVPPQTMAEMWRISEAMETYGKNMNGSSADDVYTFVYPSNAISYFRYFTINNFAQILGEQGYWDLYDLKDIAAKLETDEYRYAYETVFEGTAKMGQKTNPTGNDNRFQLLSSNSHTMALLAFSQGRGVFTPCGDWAYTEIESVNDAFTAEEVGFMSIPLVCDPDTEKVVAKPTPSSVVFAGVDRDDAQAVAAAEEKYYKIEREKVDANSVPEEDADSDYIYFERFNFSTGADVSMVIPNGSEHVEEAKQVIAFFASDEALTVFTQYTGSKLPYTYEVSSSVYGALPAFGKTTYDLYGNSTSLYDASTYKGVAYGLIGMYTTKSSSFGDLNTEMMIWDASDTAASIAQTIYTEVKNGILFKLETIDNDIAIFEDQIALA